MGNQGFRNIAGNPFVYQEDTRSVAIGLDAAAQTFKIAIKATAGALPTDTAQIIIDPATNGNVTIDPNGSGNFVVTSGNVSLTAGNLDLPDSTSVIGQIRFNSIPYFHNFGTAGITDNLFIGYNAGNFTLTAAGCLRNLGIGTASLSGLTTGDDNVCVGHNSGSTAISTSSCNTFIGSSSGAGVTVNNQTDGNTAVGYGTLSATSGSGNGMRFTALGYNALKYVTQNCNDLIAIGYNALPLACQSNNSTYIGSQAALKLTGASHNSNTIVGGASFFNATGAGTCSDNCFFGSSAAGFMSTGAIQKNVMIGSQSGYQLTTGNIQNNTFIGYFAGYSYPAASVPTSCICIGANASGTGTEANVLRIGAGSGSSAGQLASAYIHGIYGVTPSGTQNIALIDSNGQLGSSATLSPALGGKMTWTEVTGTSQAAAVSNGYIASNAALVTITLPSTAAVGQIVSIVGKGTGLHRIAQNSGQTIHFSSINTTTGTGGYIEATNIYDCVELICITANTDWVVRQVQGTYTIV